MPYIYQTPKGIDIDLRLFNKGEFTFFLSPQIIKNFFTDILDEIIYILMHAYRFIIETLCMQQIELLKKRMSS